MTTRRLLALLTILTAPVLVVAVHPPRSEDETGSSASAGPARAISDAPLGPVASLTLSPAGMWLRTTGCASPCVAPGRSGEARADDDDDEQNQGRSNGNGLRSNPMPDANAEEVSRSIAALTYAHAAKPPPGGSPALESPAEASASTGGNRAPEERVGGAGRGINDHAAGSKAESQAAAPNPSAVEQEASSVNETPATPAMPGASGGAEAPTESAIADPYTGPEPTP